MSLLFSSFNNKRPPTMKRNLDLKLISLPVLSTAILPRINALLFVVIMFTVLMTKQNSSSTQQSILRFLRT